MIIAGLFPFPVVGLLSAAVVVMAATLRCPRAALQDCLLALPLLLGMGFLSGMNLLTLGLSAVISWSVWLGLGALAGRMQSLTLTVQAAVMLAVTALVVFLAAVGDPVAYWTPILEAWYRDLAEQGVNIPVVDMARQAALMSGGLFAFSLAGVLLALLLGLRLARAAGGPESADRFSELRLGYVIGGLAAVAGLAGLAGWELYGALLIFGVAFAYQGVAVLSWWAVRRSWPRGWWWVLVLAPLLLAPLFVIELALLAGIGFVDNWFGLRRRPPAAGSG